MPRSIPLLKADLARPAAKACNRADDSACRKLARALRPESGLSSAEGAQRRSRKIKRGEVKSGFMASGSDFGFDDAVGCASFISRVTSGVNRTSERHSPERSRHASRSGTLITMMEAASTFAAQAAECATLRRDRGGSLAHRVQVGRAVAVPRAVLFPDVARREGALRAVDSGYRLGDDSAARADDHLHDRVRKGGQISSDGIPYALFAYTGAGAVDLFLELR